MAYKPPPEPREIVKIQQPISPPDAPLLIYGKSRRNAEQRPRSRFDSKTLKALGNDLKAYFEAEWHHGNQTWIIYGRVEKQTW